MVLSFSQKRIVVSKGVRKKLCTKNSRHWGLRGYSFDSFTSVGPFFFFISVEDPLRASTSLVGSTILVSLIYYSMKMGED